MRVAFGVGCAVILLVAAPIATAGELKGIVTATGMRNNADAVVYVDAIAGKTFPAPAPHARMDQKNLLFSPHVLPILQGTTVDFVNSDQVLHNVFSPDKCCDQFNLGSWPQGQSRSFTFKNRCSATVLCKVHAEMEGFIIVLPTPWFAVTDKRGAYSIKGLPDGAYTISIWHPKFKAKPGKPMPISGITTADFTLKK
jgi:plastocyanin